MRGTVDPGLSPVAHSEIMAKPRKFGKILAAVDIQHGDPPSVGSLWEIVLMLGAKTTVCHVELRPTVAAGNELDGSPSDAQETETLRALRSAALAGLGPPGADLPIVILHGDPGQRITEYADFLDVDLIVLGPRAKRSIAKTLRGSVTKYVVGNTRRSVLVLGS